VSEFKLEADPAEVGLDADRLRRARPSSMTRCGSTSRRSGR